jgi:hypothetical protein
MYSEGIASGTGLSEKTEAVEQYLLSRAKQYANTLPVKASYSLYSSSNEALVAARLQTSGGTRYSIVNADSSWVQNVQVRDTLYATVIAMDSIFVIRSSSSYYFPNPSSQYSVIPIECCARACEAYIDKFKKLLNSQSNIKIPSKSQNHILDQKGFISNIETYDVLGRKVINKHAKRFATGMLIRQDKKISNNKMVNK